MTLLVAADLGGEARRGGASPRCCSSASATPRRRSSPPGASPTCPTLGVVAVSLTAVAIVYAPFAWSRWPADDAAGRAWASVLGLALICTAIAFVLFFALIAEIGPARATLITFVNPAVAVVVGAIVLDEQITVATVGGFVLVLAGCWLSARPSRAPSDVLDLPTAAATRPLP